MESEKPVISAPSWRKTIWNTGSTCTSMTTTTTSIIAIMISEYDSTLEKYDRLVNPSKESPVDMTADVTKRIMQSCNVALKKLEAQHENGEIELDEYLEGIQTISAEMKRYANE